MSKWVVAVKWEHRSLLTDGAVGAARSKPLNPNVRHGGAPKEAEEVEVGAASSKPPDPTVRQLAAAAELGPLHDPESTGKRS